MRMLKTQKFFKFLCVLSVGDSVRLYRINSLEKKLVAGQITKIGEIRSCSGKFIVCLWLKFYETNFTPCHPHLKCFGNTIGKLSTTEIGPISSDKIYGLMEIVHCCKFKT